MNIKPALFTIAVAVSPWQVALAQSVGAASGISDLELAEIGVQFQNAINAADAERAVNLFDGGALAMRMAETIYDDTTDRADFARGAAEGNGLLNFVQQQIDSVHADGGRATYLRVHTIDNMRGPLVRYDWEDQFNYVLLIVAQGGSGYPRIADMYIAATGEKLSVSAGALSQLMLNPNRGLLSRLFGTGDVNIELVERFRAISARMRRGQNEAAYDLILALPPEIRGHRLVSGVAVQLARAVSETAYRDELIRLADEHGNDSRTALLLLSYHQSQGDFASAMQSANTLESIFGLDGTISRMKTAIAVNMGNIDSAVAYAEAGLKAEPDNVDSHWALLTAYLAARRHDDVVATLVDLEANFPIRINVERMQADAAYSGFVRSPQFVTWSENR